MQFTHGTAGIPSSGPAVLNPPERLCVQDAWVAAGQTTEPGVHWRMFGEFGVSDMRAFWVLDTNEFFYRDG